VGRLLVAHALRLIVALCVGLAIVCSILTVVGLALGGVTHPWYMAGAGIFTVLLLLAFARIAYLALSRLVDLGPAPRS
jgi:hypothetical protein